MIGMIFGLFLLGLSFLISEHFKGNAGFLAVMSLVVYVAFFAIGMG